MKLYGLGSCTACRQAEELLKKKGFTFEYIETKEDIGVVPQLEVDGEYYKGLGRINRFIREGY